MTRTVALLSLLFVVSATASDGVVQSAPGEFVRDAVGVKTYPAAPRLAQQAQVAPAILLSAAAESMPEELEAIREWNDAGRLPLKNGFARPVADALHVRLDSAVASKGSLANHARGLVATTEHGSLVWSGAVRIEGAHRVRLHLTNVRLPEGATLWVTGAGGDPIPFDKDILHQGSLYTPSVNGPTVYLEVEVPYVKDAADAATFEIREVIEIVANSSLRTPQPDDSPTCLIDAMCVNAGTFASINIAKDAIAHLQYVKGQGSFVCSGGLINDKVTNTVVPYLLTANHCFDSQASASSLETYFSYRTSSCNANFPAFPSAQLGATLLATNASSDFTFVQLNSIPSGRFLLGWTTVAPANGTKLFRVSHPFPDQYDVPAPQFYSDTNVSTSFGACQGRPQSNYLYSIGGQGGTYGGSSGSPVLLADGVVVGQLFGACGTAPGDGCDRISNASVDGRFATTFASIQQFINVTGNVATCTDSSTTLCLNNNRFKVEATFQTNSGQSGNAGVVKLTPETGYFWFFNNSNVEAVVKVIDGCGLNSRYWVFAGGLTDVRVTMTLTDTKTGQVRTYTNTAGVAFAPIQDTSAFTSCP
jgi:hypothetical protein